MTRWKYTMTLWSTVAVALAGCVAPRAGVPGGAETSGLGELAAQTSPAAPKRITVAVGAERDLQPGTSGPGVRELRQLVGAGLTYLDDRGGRRGQLAEASPTLDNGLWKVHPDGRMETTWKLRPAARWHDGTPFTADDVLFTAQVVQDRALPSFIDPDFNLVTSIEAVDAYTVVTTWKGPFINADALLSGWNFRALPRHVLENTYTEDKAAFPNLSFWTQDHVGTGPFKVYAYVPGSHYLFQAHDQYVLGRPKIDEVELRFVVGANTRMAGILAGSVDLTLGPGLSVQQALDLRSQWQGGTVSLDIEDYWIALYPQFVNPSPAVVADVRFRKALMHAVDRQAMADTLQGGLVPVAHSFLSPNQPEYNEIEVGLVRYEYNPRRSSQILEGLGYTRGADGLFRGAANGKLEVEVRSSDEEVPSKSMLAVADYWQRLGVAVSPLVYAKPRETDYRFAAPFPGFLVLNRPNDVGTLNNLLSSRARLPENSFLAPAVGNWSRYMNPEFDALIATYNVTIPKPERTLALGQIIQHISDQLNLMGLFYNPPPQVVANRLMNVSTGRSPTVRITWNIHEWDIRS